MAHDVPGQDAICAVIVSHDAGRRIERVVEVLAEQVAHIFIVDNASSPSDRQVLEALRDSYDGRVTLILNDENRWLAAALNQGTECAERGGYNYVLLSSDTDVPGGNAVAELYAALTDPDLGRVGSVNPRVVLGPLPEHETVAGEPIDCEMLVTGGCLVSMEALKAVGPQREDFLVDMIDYDFGFRLRAAGYRTLELPWVAMSYELGRTTERRFLWKTCRVHNYSPIRRYYFARNGLTLVRESGNKPLARFYRHFLASSIVKILLYEDQKLRKLRMIGLGLSHSVRGRLGPYEAP